MMMCTTQDHLPPRAALWPGALLCLLALLCCPYSAFCSEVNLSFVDSVIQM
jgi:hypothetical protein